MTAVSRLKTTIALMASIAFTAPVAAQGLFDPVVVVNDDIVTEYEVAQRSAFLQMLNSPDSGRDDVIETLINERLQRQAVDTAGLELTDEGLNAGLEEFAARANMNAEEFMAALARGGVAEETFRDFVHVGVSWRELISAQFGSRVQVSEREIDRAMGSSTGTTGIRVLVSEIIIPAPPERRDEVDDIAREIAASGSIDEFSSYAREYSATATRDAGGRLPWQDLNNLPPVLRPILLSLAPGEVTTPLPIPNAVALFQLRDIQETSTPSKEFAAIDYAAYLIPGGRSPAGLAAAAKVAAQVDVCDDLYGVAQNQPPEVLERTILPPSEIPQDIAIELSKLDPGEVSTTLTRADGQTLVFLMMCGRTAAVNEEASRQGVANSLRSARLNAYADSLLDELHADARIVTP
ncbi:peptidylprolyl isomerase [Roseobacter sp.]|uniref:peptidylprolyl isomerase n=1 Tax=Roseobacter sp. TaxID=1907202 RepID=UPI003299CB07